MELILTQVESSPPRNKGAGFAFALVETEHLMIKLLAAALVVVPSLVYAQQGGATDPERAACSPSVKRYCSNTISQGDLAILGCLQANRPKISRACKKVLADHGQ